MDVQPTSGVIVEDAHKGGRQWDVDEAMVEQETTELVKDDTTTPPLLVKNLIEGVKAVEQEVRDGAPGTA